MFRIQVTEFKSAVDPGQAAATANSPIGHVRLGPKEPQKKENATLEQ
jgi:hypothetical protein